MAFLALLLRYFVALLTLAFLLTANNATVWAQGSSNNAPPAGTYKPNAETTGPNNIYVTNPQPLTKIGSINITEDGTILENVEVTGVIRIKAANVTVRNFRIIGTTWLGIDLGEAGANILIEDGEIINSKTAAIRGSDFIARRLKIHNMGGDAFKPFRNVVLEENYIYDLGYTSDAHADGVQVIHGDNIVIRGNHFYMPWDTENYKNTQTIILQSNDGPVNNVLIEKNWINGGQVSVQVRDTDFGAPTNIRILQNQWGRLYQHQPWIINGDGTIRAGNRWEDTGELLPGQTDLPSNKKINTAPLSYQLIL